MSLDQTNSSNQPKSPLWAGSLSESHTIETPEQTNLEFPVAGIGSRALAFLVDVLIQTGVLIFAGLIAVLLFTLGIGRGTALSNWLWAGLIAFGFLLFYGYFLLFEIFWNGQTPGKRAIGIRVIKESGRRLTAFESISRNLIRIVDSMPAFYAIGLLTALLNSRSKRLGDFVAGSLVIRESRLTSREAHWHPGAADLSSHPPLPTAAQLSPEDLVLIESFLGRRDSLPDDVRRRMADEIFRRVESKLALPPENFPDIERLLESAAHARRS